VELNISENPPSSKRRQLRKVQEMIRFKPSVDPAAKELGGVMSGQAFVPVRCVRTSRLMMGRFVEQSGWWNLTELSVVGERVVPPAMSQARLAGNFGIAVGYAGCPDCGNHNYVRCNVCGGLTCWFGQGDFLCMTCGQRAAVSGGISEVNAEDFG
jgi:hypothetical protein